MFFYNKDIIFKSYFYILLSNYLLNYLKVQWNLIISNFV
jgi:hypothetical protein